MSSLLELPDELLLRALYFLDIQELFLTSRSSHRLRILSFDPLLHRLRLRYSQARVNYLLRRRPPLYSLQPPVSTIYLTRTHVAARRLHWSLVCIRLNRSLSRRPKLSTLVSANILPKECCRYDRRSGEIIWGQGVAGALVERKRRVEREHLRDGLRVWLERKAAKIRARQKDAAGGVGVLVWRFSRKVKIGDGRRTADVWPEKPKKDLVSGLKRFWEGMGGGTGARKTSQGMEYV
ncbi:hypothetical protein B0A55_03157 [Friedmanniomyces simplex]|uniref:F-box domain-containing protein n=1 Tax=Friedmanniomyces simplex TaxID=329884 RepID=A0A4U0XNR3_9PEZI|nr:hypothetical protein B0A55_03157 [Friedmanniomyces simplex]